MILLEPHSTDSYLHEEPEGVKKPQPERETPKNIPRHQKKVQESQKKAQNRVQTIPQMVVEDQIRKPKLVETHNPPKIVVGNHIPPKMVVENHNNVKTVVQNRFIKNTIVEDSKSRNKVIESMASSHADDSNGTEPPWVHLSRKLCNKFIEEHIGENFLLVFHITQWLFNLYF